MDEAAQLRQVFDTVLMVMTRWYREPVDMTTVLKGAINGAVNSVNDPYTNYFDDAAWTAFQNSLNGEVVGIGVFVDFKDHYIFVSKPIPDGPAEKAGIKAGDVIIEVDHKSTLDVPLEKAVTQIRGAVGTPVHLKLRRPSEQREFEVDVTRALVKMPTIESKMLDGQVGYIHLLQFAQDANRKFEDAYLVLKGQGAKGVVLDLRGNPGGYVDQVQQIASHFIKPGQPVIHEVSRGQEQAVNSVPVTNPIDLPVVVLVDDNSASASEILAGVMQDYKVAPIVGVKTFGKGTVQQLLKIQAGGGIKVTVAEYLTPNHHHVNGVGVTPDTVVQPWKPDDERAKPVKLTRALHVNMVGYDVLLLQERLNDLGYKQLYENGYMDGWTVGDVEAFQKDNGLDVNGVVDTQMVAKLNDLVASKVVKDRQQKDPQMDKALELLKAKLNP